MHPKSPKWLEDIVDYGRFILDVTDGRALADYEADRMPRSAVERSFEIVGEALPRIERTDPATAGRISDYRKIIGFRNRLVHGYDTTDNALVWEIVGEALPALMAEVEVLLREAEAEDTAG